MRLHQGFWTKILQLIMFNNYVQADGLTFRQMKGTATGTQVAPPFANLYLFHKFKRTLGNPNILFKSRYIDDGLLILKMNANTAPIIRDLEDASTLKLTFDESLRQGIYLDVVVYKGKRYRLTKHFDTKVYFKPTNKFLYLPAASTHMPAHFKGIVKGEAIRCVRNCSDERAFLEALRNVFKGMIARGYKGHMIKNQWRQIRFKDREKYLFGERDDKAPTGTLVTAPYHPHLKAHWRNLMKTVPIRQLFTTKKLGKLNKSQLNLLQKWPPLVICRDFPTIGKRTISAKKI